MSPHGRRRRRQQGRRTCAPQKTYLQWLRRNATTSDRHRQSFAVTFGKCTHVSRSDEMQPTCLNHIAP
ncbi:Uncharacterized protein FWK35_00038405 [Aphis craccivora]|uniref:Uncharacterized protein n=1 Tax=Aphis craccivora TaxID=307492 RepID=A0A6G0Z801_APHCR|nr:Uncharacterized protein FWK35_00038405 [Aphis craccivora]